MLEATTLMGTIGILSVIVSIIVQVLKQIIPEKFPTKLLVFIVSFIITLGFVLIFGEITLASIALGIVGSFVVSLVSMDGWEKLVDIVNRFKFPY